MSEKKTDSASVSGRAGGPSHLDAELARQGRLVEHILLTSPSPIYIFDFEKEQLQLANQSPLTFLGYSAQQIAAMPADALKALLHPDEKGRVLAHYEECLSARDGEVLEIEFRLRHSYGDWYWVAVRETPFERSPDGRVIRILGMAEDITSNRLAQEKVSYLTTHDSLTGLYNRAYYQEELARLERGRRFPVTVLIADIDNLKMVNDTRGFAAGDLLIRNAAEVLASCFRVEDVVARIGGDEFGILLPEIASISIDAIQIRIMRRIEAFNLSHPNSPLHLSIGIAAANDKEGLREALAEAERRMLAQKLSRSGQNS
jgi:diguanylate cyclase (GGDEF)-like protein/PAS domain S-box-containing protein